jgi:hypothetical protein
MYKKELKKFPALVQKIYGYAKRGSVASYILEIPAFVIVKKNIRKAAVNKKMSIAVELQTTNEFFYLRPVLTELHKRGHYIFFLVRPKLHPAAKEIISSEFSSPCPVILDIAFTQSVPAIDLYINATLCYDNEVPPKAKRALIFPHTITSKTKYDVFSTSIEKITDVFVTGEAFLRDIETYCRDF